MRTTTFGLLASGTLLLTGAMLGGTMSAPAMAAPSTIAMQDAGKAEVLSVLLFTEVDVQFDNTEVRDAINFLSNILGITITGRYSDDRTGLGIDPTAPITLNVQRRSALSVLEMILDQAQDMDETSWQLRDGYAEVGTKERLNRYREIRLYPIRDMLLEIPYFDNAGRLDLDGALEGNGGGGGGGMGGGGGGGFGGGGGGGFGGGGGGGGQGGGGQGGNIFDGGNEDVDRLPELERAQEIIDIIQELIEPDQWEAVGGTAASVRYYQGSLIIRAPDYVHRQIGGYPFAVRPVRGNTSR